MKLDGNQLRFKGPTNARAAVLVLHGGTDDAEKAKRTARRFFPATTNSHWIQDGVNDLMGSKGVASWSLKHRLAGWDIPHNPTPVREARQAIESMRLAHGGVPIILVGISMGARTAVRVAAEDNVVSVIGLIPWLPAEEPPTPLAGKHLRVGYASLDRTCPYDSMRDFIARANGVAASVTTTNVGPDIREMVLPRTWQPFTARCIEDILSRA